MPPIAVRGATPADLEEVGALIAELATYEELTDEVVFDQVELGRHLFGDDPAARVLLAIADDGHVAGMALWYPTFSTFLGKPGIWLEDLFVRPADRRQGHGMALLGRLRELTDGRIEWAVLDWNTQSIKFYEQLGARPVGGWSRYRWITDDATAAPDLR